MPADRLRKWPAGEAKGPSARNSNGARAVAERQAGLRAGFDVFAQPFTIIIRNIANRSKYKEPRACPGTSTHKPVKFIIQQFRARHPKCTKQVRTIVRGQAATSRLRCAPVRKDQKVSVGAVLRAKREKAGISQ